MVQALWYFLQNNPEAPVPFPWERCFDVRNEVMFYKNLINGTTVIDLRGRVNLGGGLFHIGNIWYDLTGRWYGYFYYDNLYDQDLPFLIAASCCGPLVYLLTPELITFCPFCCCHIFYFS